MLKIRLEGKEKEIYRFINVLKESNKYEICNISRLIRNTTSLSIYSRCYIEIEFDSEDEYDS